MTSVIVSNIYDESGGREKTPLPFKKIAREDKEQITIE